MKEYYNFTMIEYVFFTIMIVMTLTVFQAACTTNTVPKEVKIPVVLQPKNKTEIPKKPYLPIASLTETSTPDVVMKSYVASIKLTQGYCDQLEKILEAYQ